MNPASNLTRADGSQAAAGAGIAGALAAPVLASHQRRGVRLFTADVVAGLDALGQDSADCVVTSPPYWGLRDYRIAGQYGQEPTVEAYVARLVEVFERLRHVVTASGTVWLNLADTYGGSWGEYIAPHSTAPTATLRWRTAQGRQRPPQSRCRPKDLQGIPWQVALALAERGWLLRAAIVWHKPNARPESVRDRVAQRHELLFLLTTRIDHWWTPGLRVEQLPRVWSLPSPRARHGHPAPGPVELARRCIGYGCPPGGRVLDPFSGSGTTGVAAQALGRTYTGIDIDPTATTTALARLTATEHR